MIMNREKNKKDLLTDANIKSDLLKVEKNNFSGITVLYTTLIVALVLLAALLSIFHLYIGMIAAVAPLCTLIVYLYKCRCTLMRRKMIEHGGYTVTVEKLCNVLDEEDTERNIRMNRSGTAWYLYFPSQKWYIPSRNYLWSKRYHMSCEGVVNTSIVDDEFYVVLFNDTYDVGYAYPAKFFVWEGEQP